MTTNGFYKPFIIKLSDIIEIIFDLKKIYLLTGF